MMTKTLILNDFARTPFSILKNIEKEIFDNESFKNTIPSQLIEKEKSYNFAFDLPGMNKDDISLEIKNDFLNINAERKESEEQKVFSSLSFGKFVQKIKLPKDSNKENIEAKHENGVLFVTIQKSEKTLPKTIKIK